MAIKLSLKRQSNLSPDKKAFKYFRKKTQRKYNAMNDINNKILSFYVMNPTASKFYKLTLK